MFLLRTSIPAHLALVFAFTAGCSSFSATIAQERRWSAAGGKFQHRR